MEAVLVAKLHRLRIHQQPSSLPELQLCGCYHRATQRQNSHATTEDALGSSFSVTATMTVVTIRTNCFALITTQRPLKSARARVVAKQRVAVRRITPPDRVSAPH